MEKQLKNFYCICTKLDDSVNLLRSSCEKLKVNFIELNPDSYDFTKKISFSSQDLLYRASTSPRAKRLEKFLIDKSVITFYKSYERSLVSYPNLLIYQKEGIPTPKTIYGLTRDKKRLEQYAEYLGGFPLIIKAVGGSHGVGIIKIDSLSSLFSIVDYLLSNKEDELFVMKEFINSNSSARLIVLGNKVIDSIEYFAPQGDFRSNEGATPNVRLKQFSEEIKETAIKTISALGLEFGGVDIIINKDGHHFLMESNFPCFFPRAQKLTGTDISTMMLEYLIKKSDQLKK
jgi:hypothetical protein